MHITTNAAEVDEYVTATVCALLDKHGAGLLPGRDHEAPRQTNDRQLAATPPPTSTDRSDVGIIRGSG